MKKDFIKVVMNPTRIRIVQYLLVHEKGTTAEIQEELIDIPPASLYRHIKTLLDAGCICVVDETKVRGVIQKTYGLGQDPAGEYSNEKAGQMIQSALFMLMGSFAQYFEQEDIDPVKDMLSVSTSTLLFTDEEFKEFFMRLGEIIDEAMTHKMEPGRKPRRITFISSPTEEDGKDA